MSNTKICQQRRLSALMIQALFFLSIFSVYQAKAKAEGIDLQEPPFLTMNSYELKNISDKQRGVYFKTFMKLFNKELKFAPSQGDKVPLTVDQLEAAVDDDKAWKSLMLQVYTACLTNKKPNQSICSKFEDSRLKALEMGASGLTSKDELKHREKNVR